MIIIGGNGDTGRGNPCGHHNRPSDIAMTGASGARQSARYAAAQSQATASNAASNWANLALYPRSVTITLRD
jgi:hypothetical protein